MSLVAQCGFKKIRRKNIGTKAARKNVVKLTAGCLSSDRNNIIF